MVGKSGIYENQPASSAAHVPEAFLHEEERVLLAAAEVARDRDHVKR
ncbi:MAG: hypothetical protein LDL33_06345 [Desulfomonile sp.]|nr:hypothetical protein [Desulfomonile sp.]